MQLLMWYFTSLHMPFHQNFLLQELSVLVHPWWPLQLWNSCNNVWIRANGTTVVQTSRLLLLFVSKYCQYWAKMYYLCLHVILILYFYRTYLVFVEYTILWSSCWGALGMLMNWCIESVWLSHLLVLWSVLWVSGDFLLLLHSCLLCAAWR